MDYSLLPTINAFFNLTSFTLLILGYRYIKNGEREKHRKAMLSAVASSILFLSFYLLYHAKVGSVHFQGTGTARTFYLAILISHSILAVTIVPMIVLTLKRCVQGNYNLHKKIAKKTLPLWLYVSVTGVVVYVMLYHIY